MKNLKTGLALSLIALAATATPAAAYIGPGVGLGVIATIFGAIGAFFMLIAGLLWYPIKAMLRKNRQKKIGAAPAAETVVASAADEKAEKPKP
ncbi:MAG TPA: hypothetical protein PKH09_08725 [Parvularculaceae bacterium]|nr:hypothetical protein [Parvularculaceae bacterium]